MDHNPVIDLIGDALVGVEEEATTKNKTNWSKLYSRLDTNIRPLPIIEDRKKIEVVIKMLEENMQRSLEECPISLPKKINNKYGELPVTIRELIANRVRRRFQRTRHPENKKAVNALNRKVKEILSEQFNNRRDDYFQQVDHQRPGFWNLQKILKTDRTKVPHLHEERGIVHSDKGKAYASSEIAGQTTMKTKTLNTRKWIAISK